MELGHGRRGRDPGRERATPRTRAAQALAAFVAVAALAACGPRGAAASPGAGAIEGVRSRKPDVRYEPSPPEVVRTMLQIADVRPGDVVYDLGCGDGRVVIEAAKLGARGVGVDIDPERVREARANARAAGVEDRVEIREGDLFESDVSPASVVMLFLQQDLNLRLRPRLLAQLQPGARVVSHWHDMGDWKPQRTISVAGRNVYLWTIPPRAPR
jgi:SAM-dependent methyltransferase